MYGRRCRSPSRLRLLPSLDHPRRADQGGTDRCGEFVVAGGNRTRYLLSPSLAHCHYTTFSPPSCQLDCSSPYRLILSLLQELLFYGINTLFYFISIWLMVHLSASWGTDGRGAAIMSAVGVYSLSLSLSLPLSLSLSLSRSLTLYKNLFFRSSASLSPYCSPSRL